MELEIGRFSNSSSIYKKNRGASSRFWRKFVLTVSLIIWQNNSALLENKLKRGIRLKQFGYRSSNQHYIFRNYLVCVFHRLGRSLIAMNQQSSDGSSRAISSLPFKCLVYSWNSVSYLDTFNLFKVPLCSSDKLLAPQTESSNYA